LPLLPFLLVQGRHTRRMTPRLPEAAGPVAGTAGASMDGAPLRLLALGESPVAGVGVETQGQAITGQLANTLAERLQRPVLWRACGKNGVTVRDTLLQVVPTIPEQPVDLALVAFGVNDTTAFRPVARWREDLSEILAALAARCAPRLVILSGVPSLGNFPALPQPLRWVMGLKGQVLDDALRRLAERSARTLYVPLPLDPVNPALMAADGYHPSALACSVWARLLVDAYMASAKEDDSPKEQQYDGSSIA
jgi:lysophospholipase L1-like esterase